MYEKKENDSYLQFSEKTTSIESSPNPFNTETEKDKNIAIFDWDDTLFCTKYFENFKINLQKIFDYKTDLEPPTDFKARESLQLGIYSVGAKRYWNMKEGKASIYFVSSNTKVSADFKDFKEEDILETFVKTGELILKEEFEPNLEHCSSCLLKNRCPHSSAREEI